MTIYPGFTVTKKFEILIPPQFVHYTFHSIIEFIFAERLDTAFSVFFNCNICLFVLNAQIYCNVCFLIYVLIKIK